MAIWLSDPMNFALERWEDSLIGRLGIAAVESGSDFLTARMPVDERTRTPAGHLHGGAALALAETVAIWAGSSCLDATKQECVALELNATHLRTIADGHVDATARPIHLGEATQVWDVRIVSDRALLVCIARVTLAVLAAPHWH
jgi:1,4-dihydroxy-2-naphthoyl-CoA hydrolase